MRIDKLIVYCVANGNMAKKNKLTMNRETLLEANRLANRIDECKDNLKKIGYTQSEGVVARKSCFSCQGIHDGVTIPKSLFRVIGKLIESEYIQEINKLEEELNEL